MPVPIGSKQADAIIRAQAEAWFARMQRPDAESFAIEFQRWQAGDPRCAAEFARLEQKVAFTKLLRFTATGRARDLASVRSAGWAALPGGYKLAAAAMILVCVAGVASLLEGAPLPSRSVASVASVASTHVGQIRPQRLPDGSVVTLDTDSRIAFTLTAHNRIVRLVHGRARFDVAHNPARPFVVEAGGQTVTATGTVFDVALYGESLRVSLLRGSVDVAQGLARRREYVAITRLRPGEVMQATHSQPVPRITPSARGEDQWVDGMLSFKATRLSEVLAQTNRYATAKIQLAEPSLADLRVTGAVHPVPVDHLAASLASAFFLRAETLPNGSIVLHAR